MYHLVSYNIAHGRRLQPSPRGLSEDELRRNLVRIQDFLTSLEPDVVLLQEIDFDSHWNLRINLLDFLRDGTGLPYAVACTNVERAGPRPLAYGNALLSRFPAREAACHRFPPSFSGGKGFLYARLAGPEGDLPVINLHLDFLSKRMRAQQAEEVMAFVEEKEHGGAPPVIAGDFNCGRREDDAASVMRNQLHRHGGYRFARAGRTFPSWLPVRRIDHALVPRHFDVVESHAVPCLASDHRPLSVKLRRRR